MKFITSKSGDILIEFRAGSAPAPLEEYPDLPITFSCVVAKYQGKALFVYNSWRKEWELPAGIVNVDETPYEAALREFQEETGQVIRTLNYSGLCLLNLRSNHQLELGAIYRCELAQVIPFRENEETTKMMFWDEILKRRNMSTKLGLR